MEFTGRHLRGFAYAREASYRSNFPFKRKRVGAAFILGSRIITASNDMKTSPIASKLGSFHGRMHAEMSVLAGIADGSQGELYVVREKANGKMGMAKPCAFCQSMLHEKNIRHVYFSTDDDGFDYLDMRTL